MLPRPVATAPGRGFSLRRTSLLNRSRATNLGVLGLAALASISLLFNAHFYFSLESPVSSDSSDVHVLASLPDLQSKTKLDHLVIVPGHAIWVGTNPGLRTQLGEWVFRTYQTGQESSRLEVFFKHISTAAQIALEDERALVVFSGGQTQPTSTTTEGESYLRLALSAGLFQSETFSRATSENFALDSYQNLLFSIARFREFTGTYPSDITVVGYTMKQTRFSVHRTAILWPDSHFTYIGIDIDGDNTQAREGERNNGYLPYLEDHYGCHGFLAAKRISRNYAARFPPYHLSSPELAPLMGWCPQVGTQLFRGKLPWTA
ncbi:hypothetical protein C8F04DRAFT_1033875 [Mycena alexandri]|uniref:DUF218 domain-containing protein n=1 Tax=Mycena alexandri TaxID=1745969 RepID=A0AAD6T639_9AGAR|nr:hypothetical protein C8F04DRAFT_1033875 [Mycena alexandri]